MMTPLRRLALVLPLFLVPVASHAADAEAEGWKALESGAESDLSLYSRARAGSEYSEYRLELDLDAAPEDVLAALEQNLLDPDALPANFRRVLLRRDGDAVISHDYISVPFLADRDAVMRTEVERDAETGVHVMRWYSIENEGPAPGEGVVRMPSSTGSWTLAPREGGGTRAVYESHVELGSSLPAAMVDRQTAREIRLQADALRRTLRARKLAAS